MSGQPLPHDEDLSWSETRQVVTRFVIMKPHFFEKALMQWSEMPAPQALGRE